MFLGYTKLFVVGGYNGSRLARVEVLDLEDESKLYKNAKFYPIRNYGMTVGVMDNIVKSCGGAFRSVTCYNYNADSKKWTVSTPMQFGRHNHAATFIGNKWVLSGGSGSTKSLTTTVVWTGSAFKDGPSLPRGMQGHCQLTLNATHVFFALADGKPNYLFDWPNQKWTELPPMVHSITHISCGLINAQIGKEAVVAAYGKCEIFNFRTMTWRHGPKTPYFYGASDVQLSDTFIVVGGRNISTHFLDSLFRFDHIQYDWVLLKQQLEVPASGVGVVTVPNKYLTEEVLAETRLAD